MKDNKRLKRRVRNSYIVSTVSMALGLFLLGYVPVMLLTTYWPDVSLFIPRLFGFI